MKYSVGQVLYVVLKKESRIYPMQVVEEITKRTLEGELTSYMVRGGTDPKAQLLITDVDGEIFDSAEKAKTELIERATNSINRLIAHAVQKAGEWYPNSFEAPSDDPMALLKKTPGPPGPPPVPTKQPIRGRKPNDPVRELQEELAREADVESPMDAPLMTLPDGTRVKVKSVKLPDPLQ